MIGGSLTANPPAQLPALTVPTPSASTSMICPQWLTSSHLIGLSMLLDLSTITHAHKLRSQVSWGWPAGSGSSRGVPAAVGLGCAGQPLQKDGCDAVRLPGPPTPVLPTSRPTPACPGTVNHDRLDTSYLAVSCRHVARVAPPPNVIWPG